MRTPKRFVVAGVALSVATAFSACTRSEQEKGNQPGQAAVDPDAKGGQEAVKRGEMDAGHAQDSESPAGVGGMGMGGTVPPEGSQLDTSQPQATPTPAGP